MTFSSFIRPSLWCVLLALTVGLIQPAAAQPAAPKKETLNIEQAMRSWQERYVVLTGADQIYGLSNPNYYRVLVWPRNLAGENPGPYPRNCFYAEDMRKPERAALLVAALAQSIKDTLNKTGQSGGFGVIRRFDSKWPDWNLSPINGGPFTASILAKYFFWLVDPVAGTYASRLPTDAAWAADFDTAAITGPNYVQKFETLVAHWLANPVKVKWYAASTGGTGITRNFGVVLDGVELVDCDECSACQSGCRPGECRTESDKGLDIRFNLGTGSKGSLGTLRLRANAPNAAMYSPRALINLIDGRIINGSITSTPEAYAIYDYAQLDAAGLPLLRQVYLPQGLVDIVADGTGFTLSFYDPSNRGALTGGFYTPGTAYKSVRVEQNGDLGHLRLVESGNGPTNTTLYAYADNAWSKQDGNGADARTVRLASSWIIGSGTAAGDVREETRTLLDSVSAVVDKVENQYKVFPWNIDAATGLPSTWSNQREELIAATVAPDAGGKQLTTNYRYYDDVPTTDANYGRVKQVERPDGTWERYEYASDGRVAKTFSSFNDSAAPAVAAGAITGDYRLSETTYSATAPQETTTESLSVGGITTVVGRRFHAVDDTASNMTVFRDAVATSASAAYADASNLVTITRVLKTGNFPGRTERIVRPDGTISVYTYFYNNPVTGQTKITVGEGAPNTPDPVTAGDVTSGTRTATITNAQGQPISEVVTDAASGIQLSNTVYADFDAFGRWQLATFNDGTTSTRTYNCCGLESETDRTGLRTVFGHDSLNRENRQTVYLGVTTATLSDTESTFDAADHALKTIAHAAGTSIDTTVPATITVTDNTYNTAGQLTTSVSPRGSTTIDEAITAAGKRQVTTTYADGGTRIELFDRSGQRESLSGTAVPPMKYVYGVDAVGAFVQEIRIGDAAAETEWTKNYRDFAGRVADTVLADGAKITREYYAADDATAGRRGKMKAETRPADSDTVGAVGVRTLFDYNARGEPTVAALDLDQDGVIDYAGTDRITKTVADVASVTHDSVAYNVRRTTTSVWATDNTDAASAVVVNENTTDGLRSWQTANGLTTSSVTTIASATYTRTVVTTAPDATVSTQSFIGDRLQSATTTNGVTQLGRLDCLYDGYGRTERVTDARNGATTYTFYNDRSQKTVTTPDPDTTKSGPGYDAQTTQFFYDNMGRVTRTILPDLAEAYGRYWPTGATKRVWGARTTPQEMTYDLQGRLKTSATWTQFVDETSFDSTVGKAVTTWNYSTTRGWMDNKRFADNRGPNYLHYPSGALKRRTWARTVGGAALTTDYSYNFAGDLSGVIYSDSTPAVSGLVYDRLGRRTAVTDAAGALTTSYEGLTALADDESYANGSGLLAGLAVNRSRDTKLRPDTLDVPSASSVSYTYRDGSRLDTVSATVGGTTTDHTYTYQANSALLDQLVQKRSGATVLTTTKRFDKLNRLTSNAEVSSVPAVANSGAYLYNSANQRTRLTEADGKFWDFGYDPLGQVIAGAKRLSDGTAVLGHGFGYSFDTIGNLVTTQVNGQSASYTPDLSGLNQYAQRTVPAALDVLGTADAGAKVAVNLTQAQRQGDLFYKQLAVTNTSAAKWQPVDVLAGKAGAGAGGLDADTRQSGHLFLAQTPESFAYDFDGNLTSDSQWIYTWNAENQLVQIESVAAAVTAGVPKQKLEFVYDSAGRRIQKKVSNWNGSAYIVASDTRFLYDGWNLLAELNGLTSNAAVRSFVWGLDLSGSAQGAGGVGGLLAVNTASVTYLPTYDGNGNVTGLVDSSTGQRSATYTYGPFGEPIAAFGPAASVNPIRYSTKYTDAETDLVYYIFRYYSPSLKRWLSRDPIEENGGANLYGMVGNDPINGCDFLGLSGQGDPLKINVNRWSPGDCLKLIGEIATADLAIARAERELSTYATPEFLEEHPSLEAAITRIAGLGATGDVVTHLGNEAYMSSRGAPIISPRFGQPLTSGSTRGSLMTRGLGKTLKVVGPGIAILGTANDINNAIDSYSEGQYGMTLSYGAAATLELAGMFDPRFAAGAAIGVGINQSFEGVYGIIDRANYADMAENIVGNNVRTLRNSKIRRSAAEQLYKEHCSCD